MDKSIILLLCVAFLATGCRTLPSPHYATANDSPYRDVDGRERNARDNYCVYLEDVANSVSQRHAAFGVVSLILGAFAIGTGTILAGATDGTPSEATRGVMIGAPILGAAFGLLGTYSLARSSDASDMAAAAARASSLGSEGDRIRACNAALVAWHEGRSAAVAALESEVRDSTNDQNPAAPAGDNVAQISDEQRQGVLRAAMAPGAFRDQLMADGVLAPGTVLLPAAGNGNEDATDDNADDDLDTADDPP